MRKFFVFILLCCILCCTALADSDDNILSLDCGSGSVFVLMDDGRLIAWGDNSSGLIPSENIHKYINYDDRCLVMSNAESVAVGENCVLAVNSDNELYGWGNDGKISLLCGYAYGRNAKEPVKLMDNVICADSGFQHNAAVTADGSLYTWGKDTCGCLGIGLLSGSIIRQPAKIMSDIASVFCCGNNTLAITNDNRLFACGEYFGFSKPQLIASGIVDVAKSCNKTFILLNSNAEVLILQCANMKDGTPSITLTPPIASNVTAILDYGYIRDDDTLWMCKNADRNAFIPSAERVRLADCSDMKYRAFVSLRTLHIENYQAESFVKNEAHSVSDINLRIQPEASGIISSITVAIILAAIAVFIIEKPPLYFKIKEKILLVLH